MRSMWQILVGLVLITACDPADDSGDSDTETDSGTAETGDGAPGFAADVQPILETGCTCHFTPDGGGMTAPYLTLNADVSYSELVNVVSVQLPAMTRVAAWDVQNSYLVHKLRGTHVDVGGPVDTDPMPPLMALDEQQIQTIEAWIAAGAPE